MSKRYMLDTNIVSALARDPQGEVASQITKVGTEAICVSVITACELRYGCAKKQSVKLSSRIDTILDSLPVLPLEVPVDTEYAEIRASLEIAGKPIGPNDLLIAAHACALGAVLVTANTSEFIRVHRLRVENWLAHSRPVSGAHL